MWSESRSPGLSSGSGSRCAGDHNLASSLSSVSDPPGAGAGVSLHVTMEGVTPAAGARGHTGTSGGIGGEE